MFDHCQSVGPDALGEVAGHPRRACPVIPEAVRQYLGGGAGQVHRRAVALPQGWVDTDRHRDLMEDVLPSKVRIVSSGARLLRCGLGEDFPKVECVTDNSDEASDL